MTDKKNQETLIQAAVRGDLASIRHSFRQPSVQTMLARMNAMDRQQKETALANNQPPFKEYPLSYGWYAFRPWPRINATFFELLIKHNHLHVLNWFFSAGPCNLIEDTMWVLTEHLSLQIIQSDGIEALGMLLNSHLFTQVLSSRDREVALQSMLLKAYTQSSTHILRLLVAHGADVMVFCDKFPCLNSPMSKDRIAFIQELKRRGGVMTGLRSPLSCAEDVRILLACGVDLQAKHNENSPLFTAVVESNFEVVEALLIHGFADVDARGLYGDTPLMRATDRSIAALLVEYGADPRLRASGGRTVVATALRSWGGTGSLKYFCTLVPDLINAEDSRGLTPLMSVLWSSERFESEQMDILLSHGADPYKKNQRCFTAYQQLLETEIGRRYVACHPEFFPNYVPGQDISERADTMSRAQFVRSLDEKFRRRVAGGE